VPPLTCHSLCHSHGSALIAAGWDVQEVADRAGDTVGTIMTEYSHAFDSARRAQSRRDRLDAMERPLVTAAADTARQIAPAEPGDLASQRAKRGAAR
jgi:hypothetical protein